MGRNHGRKFSLWFPFLIIGGNIMDEDMGADSHFCYLGCKNLCLHALTQLLLGKASLQSSRVDRSLINVLNLTCPQE